MPLARLPAVLPRIFALALGLSQLLPLAARADDAVSVELVGRVLAGQGKPKLVVTVRQPLAGLAVDLKRSDGKSVSLGSGRTGPGRKEFALDQPEGTYHYDGKLVARFPKGAPQELPLSFDATIAGPPKITSSDDAVNLAAHTLTIAVDRDAPTLQVKVHDDGGKVVADFQEKFPDTKAGQPLTVKWEQDEGTTVLRIDVRVTDKDSYYADLTLFPWRAEVQHDEVVFATGQSTIDESEKPKLDAAYQALVKQISNYGHFAKVQVFIAGFTDTVGDPASNRQLSESRAFAIARYLKAKGVKVPMYYTGFGEDALLVPTPDETPEARNRRAAYYVAVEPPSGARWQRLP